MKPEHISDALNLLDDGIIEETAQMRHKRNGRKRAMKWAAVAACLACVIYTGVRLLPHGAPGSRLPLLTIMEDLDGGMGFEGYMAYDVSELVSANPWSATAELSTLPVYQNPLTYDENHRASGGDLDAMEAFLLDIAGRLGLDTERLEITGNAPDESRRAAILEKLRKTGEDVPEGYFDPTAVVAEADGIKIEVDLSMTATITFDPAVSLPDGYRFTHDAPYEDVEAVAGYLRETFKDLIGMDDPQLNICGGDYTIDLQQAYTIEFYEGSGSFTDQLVNYNFNRVAFYCDDGGMLFLARVYNPDLSGKIGDYPIISPDEATELLLDGNSITTVPEEMPGPEFVAKVELVYRAGRRDKFYLPYYRFYVELPDMERENGLKTYGAYYVPAVEGSYLSNMPIWDGGFN